MSIEPMVGVGINIGHDYGFHTKEEREQSEERRKAFLEENKEVPIRKDREGNPIEPFSYACRWCRDDIARGEKVYLIHLRHGKRIGKTKGTYDGYGGVKEDNVFNAMEDFLSGSDGKKNINSYHEIQKSLYDLDDSTWKEMYDRPFKIILNQETGMEEGISLLSYARRKDVAKRLMAQGKNPYSNEDVWDFLSRVKEEYNALEDNMEYRKVNRSGICAYHQVCYHDRIQYTGKASINPSKKAVTQGTDPPKERFL